jgi:hypothetical protein
MAGRNPAIATRSLATGGTVIGLKRLFARGWLHKSQRLRIVAVNGVRYKRLVLHDAYIAAEIERNLEAFGSSPRLPQLVTRFENELWLEFVPGEPLARGDDRAAAEVGAFYKEVYAKRTHPVPVADTPLPQRLERDLRFLHETKVIGTDAWRELSAAAQRLQPAQIWSGFEYTDPVLKNFVRPASGGPLCAIDVESLVSDRPLGAGIAKATVFWLTAPQYERLLAELEGSVPQLRAQMPFVELCFLARWVKTKFLTGKRKHAHEERFKAFRELA